MKRKLVNTLALEYPEDRVEILVGSDGSDDGTVEAIKGFSDRRIQCHDFRANRGKTAVQNDLVARAKGGIVVFTDAASFLRADAIKKIVRNFADERVGCVAGKMEFVHTDANITTQSQGLYWRYEVKVREWESRLGRVIGVDGPLYAVRREAYRPLQPNIISDFISPLLVLAQGKKVILEPEALVEEAPTEKTTQEFRTRRRITLRGLVGLAMHSELMNPFKHSALSFQIFFHKVLRWFVGVLVMLNFLACIGLSAHWPFKVFLLLYSVFFLSACAGWAADRLGVKVRAFMIPYYFVLVNSAATLGIVDFSRKKEVISWRPVRN